MRTKWFMLTCFSIIMLNVGCKSGPKVDPIQEALAKQYDAVIGVHDEIMPQMGKLKELQNALTEQINGLDSVAAKPMITSVDQLNAAHDGMMLWMRDFTIYETLETADEKSEFLTEQMVTVNALKEQFENSIANANNLLQSE